jgi:hypothetical protein
VVDLDRWQMFSIGWLDTGTIIGWRTDE